MSKCAIQSALRTLQPLLARALVSSLPRTEAMYCESRVNRLFEHTVMGGKYWRGRLVLSAFHALDANASAVQLTRATEMAAVVELLQAFFLTLDDVMDGGMTRRGRPCWHTLSDVGLVAINDSLVLDCAIDLVVKRALAGHVNLSRIVDSIQRAKRITVLGQMLDCATSSLSDLTWSRYETIVSHKTSHYTFLLPLEIALALADCWTHALAIENVCQRIGYLFQAQDDFLDCFGTSVETGKEGTDIRDGKCTWLMCALMEQLADDEKKRSIVQANFGAVNGVERVKQLMREAGMEERFSRFSSEYEDTLKSDIHAFPVVQLRPVLAGLLSEMMRRRR